MPSTDLSNPFKPPRKLTASDTYFEYERRVGHEAIIPFLERHLDLRGARVADFGCHQGGVLAALREDGRVASGTGFEVNQAVLDASPFLPDERFRLRQCDLLAADGLDRSFDLVLMCEVLEHVPDPRRLLEVAARALAPDGRVFVSFPPYWSPFGGHQHYASSIVRLLPYAHYLPEAALLRLARIRDLPYMSAPDATADLRAVRRARLSLRRAERAFRAAGLAIESGKHYLFRPEHVVRHGVTPGPLGPLSRVPLLREVVTMGAHYILAAQP